MHADFFLSVQTVRLCIIYKRNYIYEIIWFINMGRYFDF